MPDASDDRARLEELLLAGQPVFTLADAAARTGVPGKVIRRLWRSLGFAIPPAEEPAFNEADLRAIELMHAGSTAGLLDVDTEVRLARAVGQTMARLSEWQLSLAGAYLDEQEPLIAGQQGSRVAAAASLVDSVGDTYERLLVFAWRRHLGAAMNRVTTVAPEGEESSTVTSTVGFADIVSFSALSNELGDDRIGDLVEIFETRATDVVNHQGGRVIKTLGDSVLFVSEHADTAMDIAHGIIDVIGADSRLPDVRLGLATGSVILRFGDVFGPPVNLAARLTGIARRNRVITDEATAAQLSGSRYETRALTARPVRGFGVLEPIAVRRLAR